MRVISPQTVPHKVPLFRRLVSVSVAATFRGKCFVFEWKMNEPPFFFLPAQRQIYNRRVWNGVQCRPPLVTGRNNKPLAFRLIFLCFHCPLGGKPEPFVLVWPLFVWSKVATPPPKVKMLPTGNFLFTLRAPPTAACRHFALLTSSFSFKNNLF